MLGNLINGVQKYSHEIFLNYLFDFALITASYDGSIDSNHVAIAKDLKHPNVKYYMGRKT